MAKNFLNFNFFGCAHTFFGEFSQTSRTQVKCSEILRVRGCFCHQPWTVPLVPNHHHHTTVGTKIYAGKVFFETMDATTRFSRLKLNIPTLSVWKILNYNRFIDVFIRFSWEKIKNSGVHFSFKKSEKFFREITASFAHCPTSLHLHFPPLLNWNSLATARNVVARVRIISYSPREPQGTNFRLRNFTASAKVSARWEGRTGG